MQLQAIAHSNSTVHCNERRKKRED